VVAELGLIFLVLPLLPRSAAPPTPFQIPLELPFKAIAVGPFKFFTLKLWAFKRIIAGAFKLAI
jgi:hypothetical protein